MLENENYFDKRVGLWNQWKNMIIKLTKQSLYIIESQNNYNML